MAGGTLKNVRRSLRKLWDKSQPFLKYPRLWIAMAWRQFLRRTTFIAITGSNGKTTVTRVLAAVLSSHAPTQWTRMNRNQQGGFTETIAFSLPWKTRFAVFEVGAGARNSIRKATRLIRPDISVVLSVFLEHRSTFQTIEAVAREKADLLAGLGPDGVAVINADDPNVASMPVPPVRKVIRYGASPGNDAYFEDAVSAWPQLLHFTAVVGGRRQEIRSRLLGMHWTGPLLAAVAVADHLGVPLDQAARVIETVGPYPGRMQVVQLPSGAAVIRDEFKASEHTIEVAFKELRKARARRKFLAFCDVSETPKSPRKRLREIGRQAALLVDFALFIGDHAHHGVQGALLNGMGEDRALAFPDYEAAADFLKPLLGPGDLLLLKASRNNQLPRLFYSLLGDVRCKIPTCGKTMVCDDCPEFRNPELVRRANVELTAHPD